MFSHIQIGARDVEAMLFFYDRLLGGLGLVRMQEDESDIQPGGIWHQPGRRWPQFVVRKPFDGRPASAGNGIQTSFACRSREMVDEAWQTALRLGGSDEGAPGIRPQYASDFYGAYCRDLEGNKLCFVHAGDLF